MFVESGLALVLFLFVFGGLFLWMAKNENMAQGPNDKQIGKVMKFQTIMVLFAFFYFALAHFTMYGVLGLSVEYDNNAPCDNVLRNTTTVGNLTTYTYVDSCASLVTPPIQETYFTLFTWLLYIDLFAIALGTLVLTFRFFGASL